MYYIVNYGYGPIVDWTAHAPVERSIGPYHTYQEAMAVLYFWTK